MKTSTPSMPVAAVSVAAIRGDTVLLVKRGRPPARGFYAFPGGRVEPGESHEAAAKRELMEETALVAPVVRELRVVNIAASPKEGAPAYRLVVFAAQEIIGEAVAGDDADEARFFSRTELAALPTTDSTLEIALELLDTRYSRSLP